jgi:hypothetical protein
MQADLVRLKVNGDLCGMTSGGNRPCRRNSQLLYIQTLENQSTRQPGGPEHRRRYALLKLLDTQQKLGQFTPVRFATTLVCEQADEWRVGEWSSDAR